jgi:O-antigen/teichoic acid export membrane protein
MNMKKFNKIARLIVELFIVLLMIFITALLSTKFGFWYWGTVISSVFLYLFIGICVYNRFFQKNQVKDKKK